MMLLYSNPNQSVNKKSKEKMLPQGRGDTHQSSAPLNSFILASNYSGNLYNDLYNDLEGMMSKFWQEKDQERKTHLLSWDKMYESKQVGGMGFKDLKTFDMTLLAK